MKSNMNAEVDIPFKDAKSAKHAEKILKSEQRDTERSKANFTAKGPSLCISINASDLAALRAALNTYLRLLSIIMQNG